MLAPINLHKNEVIKLRKKDASLEEAMIGLGWSAKNVPDTFDFDLDVSCFMLSSEDKILSDRHFIYYNNKTSPDQAVIHTGDDRVGTNSSINNQEDNDNEQIIIDFSKIDNKVKKLAFCITIHEAKKRFQNFSMCENAYVRLLNNKTEQVLLRYDLNHDFSQGKNSAVLVCEIYRDQDNEWTFQAIGNAYPFELDKLVNRYYDGGSSY